MKLTLLLIVKRACQITLSTRIIWMNFFQVHGQVHMQGSFIGLNCFYLQASCFWELNSDYDCCNISKVLFTATFILCFFSEYSNVSPSQVNAICLFNFSDIYKRNFYFSIANVWDNLFFMIMNLYVFRIIDFYFH